MHIGYQSPCDIRHCTARTKSFTGANVNLRNSGDASCPQHGVVRSLGEAVEALRTGLTPEHVVCERVKSLLKILEYLLLNGLDVTALNARNRTALEEFCDLKPMLVSSNVAVISQIASVFEAALTPCLTQIPPPPPAAAPLYEALRAENDRMPRPIRTWHTSTAGAVDGGSSGQVARAPAAAVPHSWFFKIFGFEEKDGGHLGTFAFVRSQLALSQTTLGAYVFTTPQGKQFWAGRFSHESLGHLHGKLQVGSTPRGQLPALY